MAFTTTDIIALKCPHCGANVSRETMKCEYCGTNLVIFSETALEGQIKAGVPQIECENFLDGGLCQVFVEDEVARIGREEQCLRKERNSCCYTCTNQKKCDISCDVLDQIKEE